MVSLCGVTAFALPHRVTKKPAFCGAGFLGEYGKGGAGLGLSPSVFCKPGRDILNADPAARADLPLPRSRACFASERPVAQEKPLLRAGHDPTGPGRAVTCDAGALRRGFDDIRKPQALFAAQCAAYAAALAGMRFLPPLVLHGAHSVDDATLDAHVEVFVNRLARYPDWPEIEDLVCLGCDVPDADRPRHGEPA